MPRFRRPLAVLLLLAAVLVFTGAPVALAEARTAAGAVYVDGSKGDDANPGTEESPVRTFSRAKEALQADGANAICVTGAIRLSGTAETWTLGEGTLLRHPGYEGELVTLDYGASLTLENITIDGNSQSGATGKSTGGTGRGGSLIGVYRDSSLFIGSGAVLQNNTLQSNGNWYPESGGAVFADSSVVSVEGGTIRNNSAVWGGGIYGIYKTTINVSDGLITGNRAVAGDSTSLSAPYGGTGGGICVFEGAKVNISGGTISDNDAAERGGGVSVGTHYSSTPASMELTMTGGTISGNTAGSAGGGIFVQAGYSEESSGKVPTYGIARISGGEIVGNRITAEGAGNSMFGGGGIYVNGYSRDYPALRNGELYLSNAEVSGNTAEFAGGGYAACPVSVTRISLTNGAALFGNSTETGRAREIYILSSRHLLAHSGNPPYEVSPSMLGGGAYRWVDDDGEEVPLDRLEGVLNARYDESLALSNELDEDHPSVKAARALARVRISGNSSATRGGGIGSNGSVFIGSVDETIDIPVTKTWDDLEDRDGLRPKSVKLDLYRDGEYVGHQVISPDEDGAWSTTFRNLPRTALDGHEYEYAVRERDVEGYSADVRGDAKDGFEVRNLRSVSLSGTKTWNDDENRDGLRPASVTVRLLRDGGEVASKTVTADEGWSYSFEGLPKYAADGHEYAYSVAEDAVPGYEAVITGTDITNVHAPARRSVRVTKVWKGDSAGSRPKSVTVRLLVDGTPLGDPVELSKANGWTHSWEGLYEKEGGRDLVYAVEEVEVPSGYVSTVSGDAATGFTVTNEAEPTKGEPPTPKPPAPKPPAPVPPAPEPVKPSPKPVPDTGDPGAPAGPITGIVIVAVAAIATAVGMRRRRK